MSEKSIRWFCPTCNDFVSILKTEALKSSVEHAKRLPYPIIIKHGNPIHYTILQLDIELRDRGTLTTMDFFDLVNPQEETSSTFLKSDIRKKLEEISENISGIQRKLWNLLEE